MITIDNTLLQSIGLDALPSDYKTRLLHTLYDELESRVGLRISADVSVDELDEFEVLVRAGDEEGALAWLDRVRPDYEQVFREELDGCVDRLRSARASLLRSAGIAPEGSIACEHMEQEDRP